MSPIKLNSFLVFILISAGAEAQINKCNANGKIVYQQEACGREGSTGSEIKVVVPSTGGNTAYSAELERLRNDYDKAQRDFDAAIAKHCAGKKLDTPQIGMSEADLKCIKQFREPEKVNVTTTAAGESKQYVFRERHRTTYIYFRGGVLSTIQSQE